MSHAPLRNAALILLVMAAWAYTMNDDFEQTADAERREWLQAVQFCHRAFGPQTAPEYDENDMLVCVGKRGQRYAPAR